MNTDQQILELVKTGKFTLPKYLVPATSRWFVKDRGAWAWIETEQAHDICACRFARENEADDSGRWVPGIALHRMCFGDSAAAIAALHEAVCGKDACAGDSETGRLNKEQS